MGEEGGTVVRLKEEERLAAIAKAASVGKDLPRRSEGRADVQADKAAAAKPLGVVYRKMKWLLNASGHFFTQNFSGDV